MKPLYLLIPVLAFAVLASSPATALDARSLASAQERHAQAAGAPSAARYVTLLKVLQDFSEDPAALEAAYGEPNYIYLEDAVIGHIERLFGGDYYGVLIDVPDSVRGERPRTAESARCIIGVKDNPRNLEAVKFYRIGDSRTFFANYLNREDRTLNFICTDDSPSDR
ncbi:MAG: hypothetical protein LBW85_06650 [Deltaproteobacteria bacterium]|jgi:hypothetical protein|nr:hypothetical protein [Deltaproteobacteria bacterium]